MIEFEVWRYLPFMLMAPAQTAFLIIFITRRLGGADWHKTLVGRSLFFHAASFAVLIDVITVVFISNFFTGGYSSVVWYYGETPLLKFVITLYWFVAASVYYQLYALIKNRFMDD